MISALQTTDHMSVFRACLEFQLVAKSQKPHDIEGHKFDVLGNVDRRGCSGGRQELLDEHVYLLCHRRLEYPHRPLRKHAANEPALNSVGPRVDHIENVVMRAQFRGQVGAGLLNPLILVDICTCSQISQYSISSEFAHTVKSFGCIKDQLIRSLSDHRT